MARTGAYTQRQVRTNKDFRFLHKDAHLQRVLLKCIFYITPMLFVATNEHRQNDLVSANLEDVVKFER